MRFFNFQSASAMGSLALAIALAFAPTLGGQAAGAGLPAPAGGSAMATAQQSPTEAPRPLSIEERADILFARREYPAVVTLLTQALQDHGDDAGLYNRLGMAYQELSNLGPAEKNYKAALKKERHNPTYQNNLGTVYYMRGKYKQAAQQFTAAIKLDRTKAAYFVNLGGAEFARKRTKPALAAYRQALLLDPNALFPAGSGGVTMEDVSSVHPPGYHYQLARLFCSMGLLDDAVHQFNQAYEQHYSGIKDSLTDPVFAPLRARPEYQALMGPPPAPNPKP